MPNNLRYQDKREDMKSILTLVIILTLILHSHSFSQSNFRKYREHKKLQKKYTLKAEDLKPVQKDGKTSWTVKTTLTNHSHDTLFYFIWTNCEPTDFAVDTMALFVDMEKCEIGQKLTVIAVPPKGHHIVDLEIGAHKPLTFSMSFRIIVLIFKAKNMHDSVSPDELLTRELITVFSNTIKT
jgi:hypothetical protein